MKVPQGYITENSTASPLFLSSHDTRITSPFPYSRLSSTGVPYSKVV